MSRLRRICDDNRRERIAQLDLERVTDHKEKVRKPVMKFKQGKYSKA